MRFSEERIDLSLEHWASRVAWPVAKAQMTAFQDAVAFLLEGASSMYIRDFPSHGIEDGLAISRWNSAMRPRLERCVHDLVRDKMTAQPRAQAISAWDNEIIYSELDKISCRLVYYLVERDVDPEIIVGLCINKSKLRVVTMLAILRVDDVVVSLKMQYLLRRIKHIVKDTFASIILIDRAYKRQLAMLTTHI